MTKKMYTECAYHDFISISLQQAIQIVKNREYIMTESASELLPLINELEEEVLKSFERKNKIAVRVGSKRENDDEEK